MIGTLNVHPLVVLQKSEVTDGMVDKFDRDPLIRLAISTPWDISEGARQTSRCLLVRPVKGQGGCVEREKVEE
jgi:hypothetical protein